ncbi:MAG: ATP-binding cassette domain-containing protein [Oscillospiraceae bacterium]|jgi:ABC-2 type transport system ATP-binding protein|nr:ATP-binding cassette domain-containing protein [Oscillospiraceae bacterium]
MVVLKTQNLTKHYGNTAAVDNVSLTVEKGDIFGLIGQNGAGKTTLMRLVTALTFADSGEIELFGETSASGLEKARARIGCVVETPVLYPNLNAAQNLEYYRIQRGIPDRSVVHKALELVSLTDAGKKKFKNFSLGMKQRLGLALAILNNPDFLVLDEPINGLDPVGIIEMRDLMKSLNEQGVTLLLSSHILAELAQVATKYAIIHNGRLLKNITQTELRDECKRALSITVDDAPKAAVILETELNIHNYKQVATNELRVYEYLDNPGEVAFQLNQGGVRVASLHEVGDSLEDYYTRIIGGELK